MARPQFIVMDPLSITAATLAIINAISAIYKNIQHVKGLPKAFQEVGQNLGLVEETLALVKQVLGEDKGDESASEAIKRVLEGCHEKAESLKNIFEKINEKKMTERNAKEWSAIANFYRTMVLRLGKAHRVETLMQDILDGVKVLAMNQVFRTASQEQIDRLESATKKLSEVEPSIKESDFEQGGTNLTMHIASGGKGNQFHSQGNSSQTNNLGHQYTAQGNMTFGTPTTE